MYGGNYLKQGLYSLKYLTKSIYTAVRDFLLPCSESALFYSVTSDDLEDGILYDELGDSTRVSVPPKTWNGDGSMYMDLSKTLNLGTEHEIEFEFSRNTISDSYILLGLKDSTLGLITNNGNTFFYRTNSGDGVTLTIGISDTELHKYKIVRDNLIISIYVDDSKIATDTETLANNTDFTTSRLFTRQYTPSVFVGSCTYIKLTYGDKCHLFTPEEVADQLTADKITSLDGEIQLYCYNTYDGWITDDINGRTDCDEHGWTLAKALGKNLIVPYQLWENKSPHARATLNLESGKTYTINNQNALDNIVHLYGGELDDFSDAITTNLNSGTTQQFVATQDRISIYLINNNGDLANLQDFLENSQLEEGTTATTYEAWEGYYRDEALTIPYEDGTIIQALMTGIDDDGNLVFSTTECKGWVADD